MPPCYDRAAPWTRSGLCRDSQRFPQVLFGALIPAAGGRCGDADDLGSLGEREALPVHESNDLGKVGIKSCDRVTNLTASIGWRGLGLSEEGADPARQSVAPPHRPFGIGEDVAGNAEQPAAATLLIGGKATASAPRDDHGLSQEIPGILGLLNPTHEVAQEIAGILGEADLDVVVGSSHPASRMHESSPCQSKVSQSGTFSFRSPPTTLLIAMITAVRYTSSEFAA